MQPSQSDDSRIGQYKIVRQLNHQTRNKYIDRIFSLYVVYKVTSPNNPLYILKQYKKEEGYNQQVTVFKISQLFKDYFVESANNFPYQGRHIHYSISNYSQSQSLYDLRRKVKNFPLSVTKVYMYNLLFKLKIIHYEHKIAFRTLSPQDIILDKKKQLFIVGWSKPQGVITQAQVLYDCGQILYFLLTTGAFQQKGLGYKQLQKKRFLRQEYWDISKKKPYLRFFPKSQHQLSPLVELLRKLTVKGQIEKMSLNSILQEGFFRDLPQFETASNLLMEEEKKIISKQKQKLIKQFELKYKIQKIKRQNLKQEENVRDFDITKIEKVQGSIYLSTKTKQLEEENLTFQAHISDTLSQISQFPNPHHKLLLNLIYNYLTDRLSNGIDSQQVFQQEWIYLHSFSLKFKSYTIKSVTFGLDCCLKVIEDQNIVPEIQQVAMQVFLNLNEELEDNRCIKDYQLRSSRSMNTILAGKFTEYLMEGLQQIFYYAQEKQPEQQQEKQQEKQQGKQQEKQQEKQLQKE